MITTTIAIIFALITLYLFVSRKGKINECGRLKELNDITNNNLSMQTAQNDKLQLNIDDLSAQLAHRATSNTSLEGFINSVKFKKLVSKNFKFKKYIENREQITYRIEMIRYNTLTKKIDLGIVNDKYDKGSIRYIDSFELNKQEVTI